MLCSLLWFLCKFMMRLIEKVEVFSRVTLSSHVLSHGRKFALLKKLVGWNCVPARSMNQMSVMKVRWQICNRKDDLRMGIIRDKYLKAVLILFLFCWRGIHKNWNHVNQNLHCRLRNGLRVKFWKEKWLSYMDKLEACYSTNVNGRGSLFGEQLPA